jgi:5-methylthioribose kinase
LPELERFLRAGCGAVSGQLAFRESDLAGYLASLGLLAPDEPVEVEPAGEGNINWVRRVRSLARERSYVIKQARPALERFPDYRVSTQRIEFEARWYQTVARFDTERVCPAVFHFDPERRALVLEDLAGAELLTDLLARGGDATSAAAVLGRFLGAVHAGTRDPALAERFANHEMRALHGEHIFALPFRANDFPLSPAVRRRGEQIAAEPELCSRIEAAYQRYQGLSRALVHGDVQPGNVLLVAGAPRLIDAEISHLGDPAFDLGQLAGHLWLRALARGDPRTAAPAVSALWSAWSDSAGGEAQASLFSEALIYAGVEMLRRTLGAARVPEVSRDEVALRAIEAGRAWVLAPPAHPSLL